MTSYSRLDPVERAKEHAIVCQRPALKFSEGALLGNGAMGVVITTRPDAVVMTFGHNAVWDIRVAQDSTRKNILPFQDEFEYVKGIPAAIGTLGESQSFSQYTTALGRDYSQPFPKPASCGGVLLGFDRRDAELLGHRLDIATGVCEVRFLVRRPGSGPPDQPARLQICVDMKEDRLWMRFVNEAREPVNSPFLRVHLLAPASDLQVVVAPQSSRASEHTLGLQQILPDIEERILSDVAGVQGFRLIFRTNATLEVQSRIGNSNSGYQQTMDEFERGIISAGEFVASVHLDRGPASALINRSNDSPALRAAPEDYVTVQQDTEECWKDYWNCSGVALDDQFLERIWYRNLYFFNCAVRHDVTCAGLYANWPCSSSPDAWHGDYHLDYNTEQAFWHAFSSNHAEKHLAYVQMVEQILPLGQRWAQQHFGLRGACFPTCAYPLGTDFPPFPAPLLSWMICTVPWAVQSLWWHYLYTQDAEFLRTRAFKLMREAVLFLVDFMNRPEAHGPQWNDGNYHIYPTLPPELYDQRPGLDRNQDCLADLALTKFILSAFLKACKILQFEQTEQELIRQVTTILEHFPPYPTAASRSRGTVWVSVPNEDPEIIYNVPVPLMSVFPGDEHGLHSPATELEIARNTYRNHRNEGLNVLVFLNLQAARLGLLDLERFKRQVNYCLLPNGACTIRVFEALGRSGYPDTADFDQCLAYGVWFENFALPAVINECLVQSYNGIVRFFPNWSVSQAAEFRTLGAVGAFLISARWAGRQVEWIEITSKAGAPLRIYNPWPSSVRCLRTIGGATREALVSGEVLEFQTGPGEILQFRAHLTSPP